MKFIWRTKDVKESTFLTIRLWGRVCGLKRNGQRPDFILLSEAEEKELEAAGEKGVAYRRRLQNALRFNGRPV